jgi:hypothetical protein
MSATLANGGLVFFVPLLSYTPAMGYIYLHEQSSPHAARSAMAGPQPGCLLLRRQCDALLLLFDLKRLKQQTARAESPIRYEASKLAELRAALRTLAT